MRTSFVSAAVLAFASSVFAQETTPGFSVFTSPTEGQTLQAGQTFDIVWQPGTKPEYLNGTSTIVLLQGKNKGDLRVGETIVADIKNSAGTYKWNVPTGLSVADTYGLRIKLSDDKSTTADESTIFQYSFPFFIKSEASSSGTTTIRLGTGTAYTPDPTTSSTLIVTSNSTSITTAVSAAPTNSSNFTLTTSATRSASRSSSATTTGPAQQTANAGVAKSVSGGLALVGALVAFAL